MRRAFRRVGAVVWLALRPLAWARKAVGVSSGVVQVATFLGLAGAAIGGVLPGWLPESIAWRVAIVLVIMLVLMTGAAYQLQAIADRKPRLVVTREPYTELFADGDPEEDASVPFQWNLRMELANEPFEASPDAEAKRVWARLSAWKEDRSKQFLITASMGGEVFGRWMSQKGNRAQDWVDMPANGEPFVLEFAERRERGGPLYIACHVREFEQNHAIPEERFWVRVRLKGTNCEQDFWVKVDGTAGRRPECMLG